MVKKTAARCGAAWKLSCVAGLAFAIASSAQASHVGEELWLDQQVVESGNQMLAVLKQYERTPAADRAALALQLAQLAAQRKQRMVALIDASPRVAALRVLPPSVRARLPDAAQAHVEQSVQVRGAVAAMVGDDFERGRSQTRLQIAETASGRKFELRVADATLREQLGWTNKRGSVAAVHLDGRLLVTDKREMRQLLAVDGSTGGTATTATATGTVQGAQSTLVVMLNFSDKPIECTAADLQSRLFGTSGSTMNVGYQQSSGGLVSFNGAVIGPFNTSYLSTDMACDSNGWANAANAAAVAAGFNPSNYQRVSYVTPANSACGWSGLATLGGTAPTPSWVQTCQSTGVFSHELGHNLMFHHAATPTSEYGDSSDPMGPGMLVQSNAANRVMAGWIGGSRVVDVGVGGSYTIDAIENMTSALPLALRLSKADTAEKYYVSLRQGIGIDANLPSGFKGALSVHRATGTLPAKTYRVANLVAGQSWTDSVNGITITHQGLSGSGATVGVVMGSATCTRAAPGISVSPASQTASAGSTVGYSVTVTNRDSAACAASAMSLAQALPAGFSGAFGNSTLSLAAGASTVVTWSVASSANVADATYTLDVSASSASSGASPAAHAAYTTVTSSSTPPPPPPPPTSDTTGPTVSLTSPTNGATVTGGRITLAASASDASGILSVEFYVDGKLLGADASSPYTANWNLRKAARGAHVIRVRATDGAGNASEVSATVNVN